MPDRRPNIILVTTDQHRGDCIGLAGHPVVETPNLDSWINRGAYFPNRLYRNSIDHRRAASLAKRQGQL